MAKNRNKKLTKNKKLLVKDYRNILKSYKIKVPKTKSQMKKKVEDVLSEKLCRCIKSVNLKEPQSIGTCTKTIFNKRGLTRGKFTCRKTRKIEIYKKENKKTRNKTKMQKGGNLQDLFMLAEQYYDQLPEQVGLGRQPTTNMQAYLDIVHSEIFYVRDSEFYQQMLDVINGLYEDDIRNGYNQMVRNMTYLEGIPDDNEVNIFDLIHGIHKDIILDAIVDDVDVPILPSRYEEQYAQVCKLAILYYIMLLPIYERFEDQYAYIDNLEHTFGWFRENNVLK